MDGQGKENGLRRKLLTFSMAALLAFHSFGSYVLAEEISCPAEILEEEVYSGTDFSGNGAQFQEDILTDPLIQIEEVNGELSDWQDCSETEGLPEEEGRPQGETGQGEQLQNGQNTEGQSPLQTESETDEPEPLQTEEFLVSAEEAEEPEGLLTEETGMSAAFEAVVEAPAVTLSHSGRASDARMEMARMAMLSENEYGNSYGEQLSGNAAAVYQQMVVQLKDRKILAPFTVYLEEPLLFSVTSFTNDEGELEWNLDSNEIYQNEIQEQILSYAQMAYDAFVYDYPEVYWLGDLSFTWSIELNSQTDQARIREMVFTPTEEYPNAHSEEEQSRFEAKLQSICSNLAASGVQSTEEKLAWIHNYLCGFLTYTTNEHAWSAGGALLYGTVVCEGYAKTFKILCDRNGIECVLVPGLATSGNGVWEGHMWNYVRVDGSWYLIDATWDDQEGEVGVVYDYFLKGSSGYGFHNPDYGVENPLTIGEERILYRNFSSTYYSKSFAVPQLAAVDYGSSYAGHTHNWVLTARIEATCEEDGVIQYKCGICPAVKQECLNRIGHKFVEYVKDGKATCYRDGSKTAVCVNCGEATNTLRDPAGHCYVYKDNKDATALKDGTMTGVCSRCGKKIQVNNPGTKLAATIALNVSSIVLQKGQVTSKVKVTSLAKGDSVKSWKSSDTSIVKVQKDAGKTGKLTAQKKAGTATVTVTLKSGKKKSFKVTVKAGTVCTTKITGVETALTISVGKTKKLKPILSPVTSQQKITYASSDRNVAAISSSGVITAKKAGKATIKVISGSKKIEVKVTVKKKAKTEKKTSSASNSGKATTAGLLSGQTEEMVLSMEASDVPAELEVFFETELSEEGFGEAEGSGDSLDACAGLSRSVYAAQSYSGSYGAQLEGYALAAYKAMKKEYLEKRKSTEITIELSNPISYQVVRTKKKNGTFSDWSPADADAYEREVKAALAYMVQASYDAFLYDAPEVFWLGGLTYGWNVRYTSVQNATEGTAAIYSVKLTPKERYANASKEIAAFDAAADAAAAEIARKLPANASRYDTVKAIHDEVCARATYASGQAKPYAWSASGVLLKDGVVVCEGYAKTFKVLCGRLGIESVLIPGGARKADGSIEGHMWNYVRMEDGGWYLVDTTWDDQRDHCSERYLLVGSGDRGINAVIAQERTLYNVFSGAEYTKAFVLPVLASSHCHRLTNYQVLQAATCTQAGKEAAVCSRDGCGKKEVLSIPALGHAFTAYSYNQDATCIKDGTKTAVCDRCRKAKDTVTAKGTKLKPTISLNVKSIVLKTGQSTSAVKVSGLAKGDKVSSWKSSKTSVVKVSSKGKITAQKKAGSATVTVTLKSGLKAKIKVKVQKNAVKTTSITGIPKTLELKKGSSAQLSAVISPVTSLEKVTYTTSNKKIATVSTKGKIKAIKKGTAVITVKSGSKSVTCKIKVS